MKAVITPSVLSGIIEAPPSKSMAHRLLISAGLADGESEIKNIDFSDDILATLDCLKSLGAEIETEENAVRIKGTTSFLQSEKIFSAGESGSTLRFFLPILMLSEKVQTFKGEERLMERPLSVYEEICNEKGLLFSRNNKRIIVCGKLKGGKYTVKGNISSQFISGLLFALPLCEDDSLIEIIPPIESRCYIDMTIDALKKFGVCADFKKETSLYIKGKQKYKSRTVTVEGDFSNAAFIEAFNLFGSEVMPQNLSENSLQGDKVYGDYFKMLCESSPVLDVSNCPDLAPILMTVASMKNGAVLTGTKRLKIKESDRAQVMKEELSKFGADITVKENEVVIKKAELHKPEGELCAHDDHRVAMSLSVIASVYGGEICGAECVKKSYPAFFTQMKKLGLKILLTED